MKVVLPPEIESISRIKLLHLPNCNLQLRHPVESIYVSIVYLVSLGVSNPVRNSYRFPLPFFHYFIGLPILFVPTSITCKEYDNPKDVSHIFRWYFRMTGLSSSVIRRILSISSSDISDVSTYWLTS